MRILFVGLNFYPEPISTGVYSGELADYLRSKGHPLRVVTAPPYYPWWQVQAPYAAWRYQRETWQGLEIWRCPLWVPRRASGVRRLIHLASFALASAPVLVWQAQWHPDVVLSVAPTLLSAPFVLLSSRFGKAKTWLHIQDFELEAGLQLNILHAQGGLAKMADHLERRVLQGFDHLSTISRRMEQHLWQKGIPPSRTSLFPNWVDAKRIYPMARAAVSLRAQLGFNPEEVVVLYSGNMGKKQGLECLLEAAQLLAGERSLRFVLCGEGMMRRQLQEQARGLAQVRFIPLQPPENLNALLNLADLHVLPQRAEAADLVMPSKLSGMLASGRAVIGMAERQTELGEVLEAAGVRVPAGDSAALAGAIQALAHDGQRREELGRIGRTYALQHWEKEKVLQGFEEELRQWVAGLL